MAARRPVLELVATAAASSATASPLPEASLLLSTWLSPAFPIGAFSFSHGLETAIVDGRLTDGPSVVAWIEAILTSGSAWSDAVLLAEAWRGVRAEDLARLRAVAALAAVMSPSAERHLETTSLGAAFLKAVSAGWPTSSLADARAAAGEVLAYPVAVGIASAAHGLPLEPTLAMTLNAFTATLISVAVRLVPLGQTAGLRIQAALQPCIVRMAGRAAASTLDDLGSAAMLSDIAAMRHETLYSRIFRS